MGLSEMPTVRHRTLIFLRQDLKHPKRRMHHAPLFTNVVFHDRVSSGIMSLGSKR